MPDYRGRFLVGAGSGYSVGGTGGSATVTLTEAQMPSHSHSISASSEFFWGAPFRYQEDTDWSSVEIYGMKSIDPGCFLTEEFGTYELDVEIFGSVDFELYLGKFQGPVHATIGNTGGGQSHENRPPYIGVKWMIKAK